MSRSADAPNRDAGFALLIVLWTLALLALLATAIISMGRGEVRLADNLRGNALAEAAADGAAYQAIMQMVTERWEADTVPHWLKIGDSTVVVTVRDEAGMINPSFTPLERMQALLRQVDVPTQAATALAAAISDFHTAGLTEPLPQGAKMAEYQAAGLPYGPAAVPYRRLDELNLVLGMTPEIYRRLAPHLDVFAPAQTNPSLVDPVVRATLEEVPLPVRNVPSNGTQTVRIVTTAQGPGNAAFTRIAIVRLIGADPGERSPPYLILSWDQPEE